MAHQKRKNFFSASLIRTAAHESFRIIKNGTMTGSLIIIEPYAKAKGDMLFTEGKKLLYVVKGDISITINGKGETLRPGDSLYLKEEVTSLLKNEGGDNAEILFISS